LEVIYFLISRNNSTNKSFKKNKEMIFSYFEFTF
jgi:hypothetical protein